MVYKEGTSGKDSMVGTYENDMLFGLEGDDTIKGGWGSDSLYGDEGNDKLYGEANNDYLYGGDGDDLLDGGAGDDWLDAGDGKDTLKGGEGDDTIAYLDWDTAISDMNGDIADGGRGVDNLFVNLRSAEAGITFSAKDPLIQNSLLGLKFTNFETYSITGSEYADNITGYLLNDRLSGGGGNDKLYGGYGEDALEGDAGNDFLYGEAGYDYMGGGEGNDYLSGGSGGDSLSGGSGNDKLYGGTGNDSLGGGEGADLLDGGDGNDYIQSHSLFGDDLLEKDVVTAGAGNDDVAIGRTDTADGGTGTDSIWLDFTASTVGETFVFGTGSFTFASGGSMKNFEVLEFEGGSGVDKVTGWVNNDDLDGGGGNDILKGGDGNDSLNGGAGNDKLYGGNHNDFFADSDGADSAYGEAGNDTFNLSNTRMEKDTFDGGDGTDTLDIWESSMSTLINLADQTKNDGLSKGDTYKNIEVFKGGSLDDTFIGDAGKNKFYGGGGADVLNGGAGDDFLSGGTGSDLLTGGTGKDIFDFTDYASKWKGDTITDFKQGEDKLQFDLSDLGYKKAADLKLELSTGNVAKASGGVFVLETDANRLWWDADGKGTDAGPVLIATLNNVDLKTTDFIFV